MHKSLMENLGWLVLTHQDSQLFIRRLGPICIAKIQRPKSIDLAWLNAMRKKYRILTLYIEPGLTARLDKPLGISVEPFAHSATSLIDLDKSSKRILAGLSQKTRYNIVHSLKKQQLTIRSTLLNRLSDQQIADLFALRTSWSLSKHVVGYSETLLKAVMEGYQGHAVLHTAYEGNECVGALLVLEHDHVATYYAAFATSSGYSHFAPTLLTWQAMQTAKKRGCDIFDFGGIYDERYPRMYKKWRGFTKFKEGFHPTVITYPATYLKIGWPLI
jgi:lipid II:glycine glycyltransferase (peptidoglycan interpeptide bridge formation enzyme)